MKDTGGIVLYFHVAKAGGTTVRDVFKERANNNNNNNISADVTVVERSTYGRGMKNIRDWVAHPPPSQILFVEIHDGPNPTFLELAPTIRELRANATVPFFVFTSLREPLSYSVSYYNFENIRLGQHMAKYERGNGTEGNFLELIPSNPQCLFFARGEMATSALEKEKRANLTEDACINETYQALHDTMDWIGCMERFDTETLPLLHYLLSGERQRNSARRHSNAMVRRNPLDISLDNLTNAGLRALRERMHADTVMYEKARKDYPASMWDCLFDSFD